MSQNTQSAAAAQLPPHEPSICIPRVEKNFSDGMIIDGIQQLGYGEVEKVDMICKEAPNGTEYYTSFVHFKKWNTDAETTKQRDAFMRGEKEKVVYDEDTGAYWIMSRSYTQRPGGRTQKKFTQKAPYIDGEGWSTITRKRKTYTTWSPKKETKPYVPVSTESKKKSTNTFFGLASNEDDDVEDSE